MNGYLLGAAAVVWAASMWQLEIIYIGLSSGWEGFDFPFGIGDRLTFSMARDVFYTINLLAVILAVAGGAL